VAAILAARGGKALDADGAPKINKNKPTVTVVTTRSPNGHATSSQSITYAHSGGNTPEEVVGTVLTVVGVPSTALAAYLALWPASTRRRERTLADLG